MNKTKVVKAVCCVGIVALLAGCATGGKGPSDEEQIMAALEVWAAAQVAEDIDAMMVLFSDDFSTNDIADKDGLREFMEQAIDMGYFEGVEVSLADVEIEIDGDTATVYPIEWMSDAAELTMETTVKKEADGWKCVDLVIEGL